jgi:hypothetical protein
VCVAKPLSRCDSTLGTARSSGEMAEDMEGDEDRRPLDERLKYSVVLQYVFLITVRGWVEDIFKLRLATITVASDHRSRASDGRDR